MQRTRKPSLASSSSEATPKQREEAWQNMVEALQNHMVDNISPAELNHAFITHIGDEFVLGVRRTPSAHGEDAAVPL